MKKAIGALCAATLAITTAANAGTPQQNLYAYLIHQAKKSWNCPNVPASSVDYRFCNPLPVIGSAKDAALALQSMRNIEALGILCAAHDSNACLRQGAIYKSVQKLGWCARPTIGYNEENVIAWARCPKNGIIILNKAH